MKLYTHCLSIAHLTKVFRFIKGSTQLYHKVSKLSVSKGAAAKKNYMVSIKYFFSNSCYLSCLSTHILSFIQLHEMGLKISSILE